MANTIEILGDEVTFARLVEGTLEEFEDDTVNTTKGYAFAFSAIKRCVLPKLQSIEDYTFYNCGSLTSLVIGRLKYFGHSVFTECSLEGNFDFGDVTEILSSSGYESPFKKSKIESITGEYVTSCGVNNFAYMEDIKLISFPNLTKISSPQFSNIQFDGIQNQCDLYLPKVENISSSSNYKFSTQCTYRNVDFSGLVAVKSYLFDGYISRLCIDKLILKKAGSIEDKFANNAPINKVFILSDSVCSISGINSLAHIMSIKVPYRLLEEYKNATNWSSYASRITYAEEPTSIESITYEIKPFKGRMDKAVMQYEAVCNCSILGEPQNYTITVTGEVESEYIGTNPSTDTARDVSVTFKLYDRTITENVTQDVYQQEEYIEIINNSFPTANGASFANWVEAPSEFQLPGYKVFTIDKKTDGYQLTKYSTIMMRSHGSLNKSIYICGAGYGNKPKLMSGSSDYRNAYTTNDVSYGNSTPNSIDDYTEYEYESEKYVYAMWGHSEEYYVYARPYLAIPKEYL